MKVTAALRLLTAIMSSRDAAILGTEDVTASMGDATLTSELDLGACLDVCDLGGNPGGDLDGGVTLYGDPELQVGWADNVIDMASSGREDLTSSDEHAGVVPGSLELPSPLTHGGLHVLVTPDNGEQWALTTPSPRGDATKWGAFTKYDLDTNPKVSYPGANLNFSSPELDTNPKVTVRDRTTLDLSTLELAASVDDNTSSPTFTLANASQPSAALTTTVDFSELFPTHDVTAGTIDVTSLQDLLVLNNEELGERDAKPAANIPNGLWNLDLTLSDVPTSTVTLSSSAPSGCDVKRSLKTRLSSRASVTSCGQDDDATRCSTLSLSSSTSSLTQSADDAEIEDGALYWEKREKNRLAAQKCRSRKREKTESLEQDVSRLEERQERLKEKVRLLRDERDTLENIIQVHQMVCPKVRKLSQP